MEVEMNVKTRLQDCTQIVQQRSDVLLSVTRRASHSNHVCSMKLTSSWLKGRKRINHTQEMNIWCHNIRVHCGPSQRQCKATVLGRLAEFTKVLA